MYTASFLLTRGTYSLSSSFSSIKASADSEISYLTLTLTVPSVCTFMFWSGGFEELSWAIVVAAF